MISHKFIKAPLFPVWSLRQVDADATRSSRKQSLSLCNQAVPDHLACSAPSREIHREHISVTDGKTTTTTVSVEDTTAVDHTYHTRQVSKHCTHLLHRLPWFYLHIITRVPTLIPRTSIPCDAQASLTASSPTFTCSEILHDIVGTLLRRMAPIFCATWAYPRTCQC